MINAYRYGKRSILACLSIALAAVSGITAAHACTGFYVGKNVSRDGSIIFGRTIDHGATGGSRAVIVPRVENKPGRVYKRTSKGRGDFTWRLPATTYRYVMTPMSSGYECGEWSSCCINEKGLGITGTVTGSVRRRVRSAFSYTRGGMAEFNYPALVAASCATAREAVALTAEVMAKHGTSEPNIYMVTDREEAWLIETYIGHLWAAHKLSDDVAGGFGNHFVLGCYDPKSDDWRATPGIEKMLAEKNLAVYENGKLHLEKSIGGSRTNLTNLRSWFAKRLIAPGTEGEYATKRHFDCFYKPSRKLCAADIAAFMRCRYDGTPWDPDANDRNDVRVIGTEITMSAHVIEVRPDLPAERAAMAWVSFGPPEHCPYLPLAACAGEVDEAYSRDNTDSEVCASRYVPERYAADAFRRLAALSAQNRECYGDSVRDYWREREAELFAKWPAVFVKGDMREIDAFTVREQKRAMADALRMAGEVELSMAHNARKFVQFPWGYRPKYKYVPSDVAAKRKERRPDDPEVVVPEGASKAVVAAADEFRKYWKAVTGRSVAEKSSVRVTFKVDAALDGVYDEYRITSDGKGAVFAGANDRAVLYAVYDFFERQAGCRWFWDGDKIPQKETICLKDLDVREKSRFEYRGLRYFAHRGLTRFQAEHWNLNAWKKEIDWMLKRRLNVFMPRIGMDDTWQKAYPDVVPYPDPTASADDNLGGYNNRVEVWGLKARGELRKSFTEYAFDRGLMIPTDFGTMTHWYSRTPVEFLKKYNPPFLPQANRNYNERTGLVWDIFQGDWLDKYWHLTEAFIGAGYGDGRLLHTIGLGERFCFNDAAKNLKMKKDVLSAITKKALSKYPDAKIFLAGWDFYCCWKSAEVRELVKELDPKNTIIWDYECDAVVGGDAFKLDPEGISLFTKWDVVGKFPYTFGIFLAYESALDIRANYKVIEEREKLVANDPFCKGYIFWPESSHTDTFLLRYFTANSWKPGQSHKKLLPEFCRDRYGKNAAKFEEVWKRVIEIAPILGWWGNWGMNVTWWSTEDYLGGRDLKKDEEALAYGPEALGILAEIEPEDAFQRRDVIDLARTIIDRSIIAARYRLVRDHKAWCSGGLSADKVKRSAAAFLKLVDAGTDVLALHTDYSLGESYDRLCEDGDAIAPQFEKVLLDNAANSYCRSHHYEIAAGWYKPMAYKVVDEILRRVDAGDTTPMPKEFLEQLHKKMYEKLMSTGIGPLRPTLPRIRREYLRVLGNAREGAAM